MSSKPSVPVEDDEPDTPTRTNSKSEQVESSKKTSLVKHRAPWKQPFQLVPDCPEIRIKRSFQTIAEG